MSRVIAFCGHQQSRMDRGQAVDPEEDCPDCGRLAAQLDELDKPCGITRERAAIILAQPEWRYSYREPWMSSLQRLYPDGLTQPEVRALKRLWNTLPGWYSLHDTLRLIAEGKADADTNEPTLNEAGRAQVRENELARLRRGG